MIRSVRIVVLLFMAAAPTAASAKSWPDAGGWSIAEGETGCGIFSGFDGKGDTELTVLLNTDGSSGAMLTNLGWNAAEGEKYEIAWVLNGNRYEGTNFGTGRKYETRKGFVAQFDGSFLDDFAGGSSLNVYRGEILVDQLSLAGSAAAVAVAKRCVAHVKALRDAEEREKQKFSHISDDPFAVRRTKAEVEKFGDLQPQPLSRGFSITNDDYPALAMREKRGGVTGFSLKIGDEGRVTGCEITSSSGHADLDDETCKLLTRRMRFSPGDAGRTYQNKVTWSP